MGLLERFFDWIQPLPSFEEIRRSNIEAASTFSLERVLEELERYPFSRPETRGEMLRLARTRPFDDRSYEQCHALIRLDKPFARPGSVEEIWYLEGLIERLRALCEAARR